MEYGHVGHAMLAACRMLAACSMQACTCPAPACYAAACHHPADHSQQHHTLIEGRRWVAVAINYDHCFRLLLRWLRWLLRWSCSCRCLLRSLTATAGRPCCTRIAARALILPAEGAHPARARRAAAPAVAAAVERAVQRLRRLAALARVLVVVVPAGRGRVALLRRVAAARGEACERPAVLIAARDGGARRR